MSPLFSICIPFAGGLDYLATAVRSVFDQTENDFELIVALDVPIDEASRIQIAEDRRVVWVENPNPGLPQNWNFSLTHVRGRYVVFLHADDFLHSNYLEDMRVLMSANPEAGLAYCRAELCNQKGNKTVTLRSIVKDWIAPSGPSTVIEGDGGLESLLRGCYIYCPTVCYRTQVLRELMFDDRWKMVPDLDLYARALMRDVRIIGLDRKRYFYRVHNHSATDALTRNGVRFIEEWALYNEIASRANEMNWERSRRAARWKVMLRLHVTVELVKSSVSLDFNRVLMLWVQLLSR